MSTSDTVVEILVEEGRYQPLPRPFKIGSQSFDFTHALVAGDRANDIVIVIELKTDTPDEAVTRKVLAFTRALDVLHSKRPVTAILTSGQPSSQTVQTMSKVCRVLSVGVPDSLGAVRDWLAVLLPLSPPSAAETVLDWEADLRKATPASVRGPLMEALIVAASAGQEAVEAVLAGHIGESVRAVLDDESTAS